MESSKIFEEAEECQSSESGWTMYIGSPIHGDDDDDDDDGDHSKDDGYADGGGDGKDDNSDDSMASDASSGPSLQVNLYGNVKDGPAISHFNHDDDMYAGGSYCHKKTQKPLTERQKVGHGMRKTEEKENKCLKAKGHSSATTSQSGSKVGKNLWIGRRK